MNALSPTAVVQGLSKLDGWALTGDGDEIAIEKTFGFANHMETMAFAQAVGYAAQRMNHHPEMLIRYNQCVVRWRTHDAKGITSLDFTAAQRVDALNA